MKVLIADPDWRFSDKTCRFLESHAHLVVCQPQASEALERARHWHPDLVMVDTELASRGLLESLGGLRPRPAVLLTGWMDRCDLVWRAWQRGGDELLLKPVLRSSDLLDAVAAALENAAADRRRLPKAASA